MAIIGFSFSRITKNTATLLTLGIFQFACAGAPTSPSTSPKTPKSGTGTETKSGKTGSNGQFDLCEDGLKSNEQLKAFQSYVNNLCSTNQLEMLRNDENIYKGSDNKIIETSKVLGNVESSLLLMTSAIYKVPIEDYWALLRLQFLKPKVFSEHFERDPDTTVSDVKPESESVTFRYENSSGEGGKVDYYAQTDLLELGADQAYTTATRLTESKETLKDVKGLIIVNKIDDEQIEVFTTSYQVFSHAAGQGEDYYNRAIRSFKNEQKRAWNNAKQAHKAKDLLDN